MIYLNTFLKRILYLIIIYTSSRLFLFYNNLDSFAVYSLLEFAEGIRFDISVLFYINIPLLLLLLIPNKYRERDIYRKITNIIFYSFNIPFILLNNIDIEYFRFTQKRSTIDFFKLLQLGQDSKNIIPQYIKEYWPITIFTIIQLYFLFKIKYIPKQVLLLNTRNILTSSFTFIIGIGIFIVSVRGGLQLKPIKPINAGEISYSKNTALILNTPFCILHSIGKQKLNKKEYFSFEILDSIYTPNHHFKNLEFNKKNIIILIMESLSKEFVSGYVKDGHTPFIDSLMKHSLVFENAFSTGLKSIEALPAITASIPMLMTNPLITSSYAQNNFKSLASILAKEGYTTSFYHGGFKGTMGFDSFSLKAGFQKYFGLKEYNNMKDYDGTWGIFDEDFLKFYAENLNNEQEPFFSTFFTVSLHPPFVIPNKYKNKFTDSKDVYNVVKYTDLSLSKFFNQIKSEKWFRETIFIITADHTCGSRYNNLYKNKIGKYAIPLIVFSGDSTVTGNIKEISQQIDIMPTCLELLGYNKPFFAFGKPISYNDSWSISFLQNEYTFITDNGIIINKEEVYNMYNDWALSNEIQLNMNDVLKLKAIKQHYNNRMIENRLIYEN